jgi:hypothetical protein
VTVRKEALVAESRLSIQIDEDVMARAKARAALEHVTVSDVVRAFLEEWAAGEPKRAGSKPQAANETGAELRRQVIQQYNAGADVAQIGQDLGLSIEAVGRILRDNRQQKSRTR